MKLNKYARWRGLLGIAMGVMLLFLCFPGITEAHSALTKASPAANSRLQAAPKAVSLTFNEPLEPELYSIKVLDSSGESVTANKAKINDDHTGLALDLPALDDGVYTVSYKVISADGHPIGSSYVFSVGAAGAAANPAGAFAGTGSGLAWPMTLPSALIFLTRILYYFGLLSLAGWTFWGMLTAAKAPSGAAAANRKWMGYLKVAFLVSFLLMAAAQLGELLDSWSLQGLEQLLTGTTIGYSWLAIAALSIVGFFLLSRWKWLDAIWIALLLGADSINGHAMAFAPKTDLVVLDGVHLFAASVWAGGLLYIAVHWRKRRDEALRFLPRFSGWALSSLLLLVATGAILTFAFLPRLHYVLYTQWGILLLAKIALVLLVVAVGALLRRRLKKQGSAMNALLKTDFALMLVITAVVGVFTYLNPTPLNEPLYWHEIGEKAHMTVEITPNAPGKNDIYVQVWTREQLPAPKYVQLKLTPRDGEDTPPIEVPIEAVALDAEQPSLFEGFRVYAYEAEGPYLPFPGKWEAEIRIMDANDDESVFKHQMTIY